jgi:hypothetical protein
MGLSPFVGRGYRLPITYGSVYTMSIQNGDSPKHIGPKVIFDHFRPNREGARRPSRKIEKIADSFS